MRVRRIETVIRFVSHQPASSRRYARLLGIEPTPYAAPCLGFDGRTYPILAPRRPGTGRGGTGAWFLVADVDATYRELGAAGFVFNDPLFDIPSGRLVTLYDPDGNIVGFIDNSMGAMPGQHA